MLTICTVLGLIIFSIYGRSAGLYCLSCTRGASPRLCHSLKKCSEGEVCFVKRYKSRNGLNLFDTGCGSQQTQMLLSSHIENPDHIEKVDPLYHHIDCINVCNTTLCNNQGCGAPGYPRERSPACFDCQTVYDPTLCDVVRVCGDHEICYIQEEYEFNEYYYSSKCINKHDCERHQNNPVFGKRNIGLCSKCCSTDLCNDGCGENITRTTGIPSRTKPITPAPLSNAGSRGREFLVLFMHNIDEATGPLNAYITTKQSTFLTVSTSPNLNHIIKRQVDRNLSFALHKNIFFPFNLTCDELTVEYKAILLKTTEPSTVTVFDSDYIFSNDGTLVIPTNKLSNKYLISTSEERYRHDRSRYQFAIGVLENDTIIYIWFRIKDNEPITIRGKKYSSGDPLKFSLGELETFQVSHTRDLTGTYITSNKPIAVFSGNKCQAFLMYTGCSHMVSQLPPIDQLDNEYIVPPFYDNSGTLIQLLTPFQNTINISVGVNFSTWHLKEYDHKNVEVTSNNVTLLKSDYPVMVIGYAMGSVKNDPYMTVIPGVHQYLDYYKIIVPEQYKENFISLILPYHSLNNIRINGRTYHSYIAVVNQTMNFPEKSFHNLVLQVIQGVYELRTTDHQTFGLLVYGHRNYDGYGFAGNFVLP